MNQLSPTYDIPSRQTITNIIDGKYDALKFAKAEKFRNTPFLSLTCDLWTETHNHTGVFGITCHYIEKGQLKSSILGKEKGM